MKKIFTIIVFCMLLSGCTSKSVDLSSQIKHELSKMQEWKVLGTNMRKPLYSYYLPQGVGRKDSTALGEVFRIRNHLLVMNIDPSYVVIKKFYEKKESLTEQDVSVLQKEDIMVYEGTYQTIDNTYHKYKLSIREQENLCVLYFNGEFVNFYTIIPRSEVVSFLKAIMKIASSVVLNSERILSNYSMKTIENVKKKSLDYLEKNLPSNGSLNELLEGNKNEGIHQGDVTE